MTTGGYTAYKDHKKLDFVLRALGGGGQGRRVLEVGCGSGNITAALGEAGWRVTGLDIDPTSVEQARARAPLAHLIIADATALPLGALFDAVVCSEVLEHLTQPVAALTEICRVLRPGGPLVVTVPNGWGPYEVTNRCLDWCGLRGTVKALVINRQERERRQRESTFNPHTPHEQHFTRGRLNRLLESAGFRVERVGHSDFMSWVPYLRHLRPWAQFDCAIADRLPSILVSGWAIQARRR